MSINRDTMQVSHPLLPPSLPALNLSQHQGLFQWVGCLQQVAKYWSLSFSFSISPSNEYSGLIFFRIDWLDLLDVPGTLKRVFSSFHHLYEIMWKLPILVLKVCSVMSYSVCMHLVALLGEHIWSEHGLHFPLGCAGNHLLGERQDWFQRD